MEIDFFPLTRDLEMASQNIEAQASFVRAFFFDKDQVEEIVTFLPDTLPTTAIISGFFEGSCSLCL